MIGLDGPGAVEAMATGMWVLGNLLRNLGLLSFAIAFATRPDLDPTDPDDQWVWLYLFGHLTTAAIGQVFIFSSTVLAWMTGSWS